MIPVAYRRAIYHNNSCIRNDSHAVLWSIKSVCQEDNSAFKEGHLLQGSQYSALRTGIFTFDLGLWLQQTLTHYTSKFTMFTMTAIVERVFIVIVEGAFIAWRKPESLPRHPSPGRRKNKGKKNPTHGDHFKPLCAISWVSYRRFLLAQRSWRDRDKLGIPATAADGEIIPVWA